MSHGLYRLDAFDCDEPEDIITQSIPESCSADTAEEKEPEERQEYTILQKVPTFEYPATLCTLRRSRHYYDCVWASHIRIAAPAKIYAQENLRIEECMTANNARVYLDSSSGFQHTLQNIEVNYIQTVVDGSISYDGKHPSCSGKDSIVDGHRIASLVTTESLEITIRTVTVREEYATGDLVIKENGVSIPAVFKHDGGMSTDFRTLVFYRGQPPCQWKRVRDITASRRPRMGAIGTELIDQDQHVHVTLHEPTAEALGCPADYVWSSTGEPRIRVVQMIGGGPRREQDFPELRPEEILFAAGVNLKLEHAFYQMRE